jgi:hypothetical protein
MIRIAKTTIGLLALTLGGCAGDGGEDGTGRGGGGGGGGSGSGSGGSEASPIECYATDGCDPAVDYCIESQINGVLLGGTCAPLDGCSTCGCVQDQDVDAVWRELQDDTDNCSGAVLYCEQHDAAIVLTCDKAAL